jgi:hypothetical protein
VPNSGIDFILAKIPKEIHDLSHNPNSSTVFLARTNSMEKKNQRLNKMLYLLREVLLWKYRTIKNQNHEKVFWSLWNL